MSSEERTTAVPSAPAVAPEQAPANAGPAQSFGDTAFAALAGVSPAMGLAGGRGLSTAQVLALQRSAGNSVVAGMLMRDSPAAPAPAAGPKAADTAHMAFVESRMKEIQTNAGLRNKEFSKARDTCKEELQNVHTYLTEVSTSYTAAYDSFSAVLADADVAAANAKQVGEFVQDVLVAALADKIVAAYAATKIVKTIASKAGALVAHLGGAAASEGTEKALGGVADAGSSEAKPSDTKAKAGASAAAKIQSALDSVGVAIGELPTFSAASDSQTSLAESAANVGKEAGKLAGGATNAEHDEQWVRECEPLAEKDEQAGIRLYSEVAARVIEYQALMKEAQKGPAEIDSYNLERRLWIQWGTSLSNEEANEYLDNDAIVARMRTFSLYEPLPSGAQGNHPMYRLRELKEWAQIQDEDDAWHAQAQEPPAPIPAPPTPPEPDHTPGPGEEPNQTPANATPATGTPQPQPQPQ
jgi:hypothetical protein